jgi:glycosyltransferase involved in cell wall biosynthesis
MELSIIVTSFQRAHLLKWGLLSLSRQIMPFSYEILVINDGLEDKTKEVCDSFSNLPIKYIFSGNRNSDSPKWRVAGFAINIGVKQARGKNIILTCAEIFVLEDCIKQIVDLLNSNPKNVLITDGKDDSNSIFLNSVIQTNGNPDLNLYFTMDKLSTEFPFFMGINRQEVLNIGGYDEDFIGYAWDDKDFSDRLLWNGGHLIKLSSRIVHLYHERNTNRPGIPVSSIPELINYNQTLYNQRKGQAIRNIGKDWGKLEC